MVSRLKDTLLLIGDASSDRAKLRTIFESGYNLLEASNVPQAIMLLEQNAECVAAVIADFPLGDGTALRSLVAACRPDAENGIPVIVLVTPVGTGERENFALSLGITDVVLKPYAPTIIQKRVQIIANFFLQKAHLATLVDEQSAKIRSTNQVMVDALSAIIEYRSSESGNHVLRIRRFTKILLEEVARTCPEYELTPDTIDIIANAAALHDIGKISIPDAILNKPAKLTDEEFEVMKTHTTIGCELIQTLGGMGDKEYLRYAYNICRYHHERWTGGGYPEGLVGDEIPICAQVVSIADVFDALTTPRVYKPAYPLQTAFNMILNNECGKFSPKLLVCFKNVRNQFVDLAHRYADGFSPKDDTIAVPLPGPSWKKNTLDAMQLEHIKYRALQHYLDDTIVELDLDNSLYHVVYNPNPDFDAIVPTAAFDGLSGFMDFVDVHPDDREALAELCRFMSEDFFRMNLHRHSFTCRIFSPSLRDYQNYELAFLHINTGNADQRIVTMIWRRLRGETPVHSAPAAPQLSSLHAAPALHGLVSSALRCRCDAEQTIDTGADALYTLTGFSAEDIHRDFGGKLLNLVVPDDRERFLSAVQAQLSKGGHTENEFRLLRKNAAPLWVLAKSRVYVESDGQEYVYYAIHDNSRSKEIERQMKQTADRNQAVIDQTGGIVFEWDILSDKMYCSSKWKEHFGYEPISDNYGKRLGIATHFHPDDVQMIEQLIGEIKENGAAVCADVRIADVNARYLWTRISATAHLDENGNPIRIVGFLQDIDPLKRAEQTLLERAQVDALTGLYNKSSTEKLISDYLAQSTPDTLAAMMVVDLDNFKSINDTYGHLHGDTVLKKFSRSLKSLFRGDDIIGRIGGDEFMVLMRNIPSEDLVYRRCAQLLETARGVLEEVAPNLNTSCSIGAALIPQHGAEYEALFLRADEALYRSKHKGKNAWTIWESGEISAVEADALTRGITAIDSDTMPGAANESFVHHAFRRLYESTDVFATLDSILAFVGEQLNVSRVYIFENNADNTLCSNTFEWCNAGIEPQREYLQNVSYLTDIAGWPDVFDERGVFYCADISTLEERFRAILEPQEIKSMLQCAIMDAGIFRGYIGFDECTVNRRWTQEQIELLKFLAEIVVVFLLKKRQQDQSQRQAETLRSILDQQDDWIYVIDPESCEIRFLNAKSQQLTANTAPGTPCYRALRQRDSRCEDCPARNLKPGERKSVRINNWHSGLSIISNAAQIDWNGEIACLVTCHEIDSAP